MNTLSMVCWCAGCPEEWQGEVDHEKSQVEIPNTHRVQGADCLSLQIGLGCDENHWQTSLQGPVACLVLHPLVYPLSSPPSLVKHLSKSRMAPVLHLASYLFLAPQNLFWAESLLPQLIGLN